MGVPRVRVRVRRIQGRVGGGEAMPDVRRAPIRVEDAARDASGDLFSRRRGGVGGVLVFDRQDLMFVSFCVERTIDVSRRLFGNEGTFFRRRV